MASKTLRTESAADNLVTFPARPRRLRADVIPFDPSIPSHIAAWEAVWDFGMAQLQAEDR
jgi:hypothetical protein